MTRHQEQIEVATFNGKTDILVKADFAAVAQLQASHTTTCEWPTSAHENVALVLHSLLPLQSFGAPRQVTCDIWGTWSDAKQDEEFVTCAWASDDDDTQRRLSSEIQRQE